MNISSTNEKSRPARQRGFNRISATTVLMLFLALAATSAHGKCASHMSSNGSLQAYRFGNDCSIGSSTRIGVGVYHVTVGYPLDEEIDEESGVRSYSFEQGICSASISNGDAYASSIKLSPSVKPTQMFQDVPENFPAYIVYTVRTFAATAGPTLIPADQDFTMMCIGTPPYISP